MSILYDKFNIIENPIKDIYKQDIIPLIDNYLENLLVCDEKIIHPDFFLSLSFFKIDIDYNKLIIKHLENYLKQKKLSIRSNIKKGNFELEILIKLIENYSDKIKKIYQISNDPIIKKIASSQLYEEIILENSLNSFLKSELSTVDESKLKTVNLLINKMKDIQENNPETKSYQWFLFLIASSLCSTVEENFNKKLPISEDYQNIINFSTNANFCNKIYNFYKDSPASKEINIIICSSVKLLIEKLIDIFNTCTLNQINKVKKVNYETFDIIINKLNLPFENKLIRDIITSKFFIIIDQQIKDFNNKITLLNELTECFQIFEKIINNSSTTRDIIDLKISTIFSNESTQNYLIETIHNNIIKNDIDDQILINILGFCSGIKDKDKLIDKYNRFLILRILNKPKIMIEKLYLSILNDKFGDKLLFKTNKIITDMENSVKDNSNFKELELKDFDKLNVLTTSYNNWDINQQEGLLVVTHEDSLGSNLYKHLQIYEDFYTKRYANKRKLYWYPHFGEITFDYLGKEIKMLPIQFLILEYVFANNNILTKDNLINAKFLSNYNLSFKQSLISSLVFGRILVIKETISVYKTVLNISSDFINIFFSTTDYGNIWENKRQEELIMNRQDVISSQINHFLKKNSLNKEDLFTMVCENIKVFDCKDSKELFNKTIDYMIDKDYIKYNDTMLEKLFY